MGARLPASALSALQNDDKLEESRWHGLDDAQLDEEIHTYRTSVSALSKELSAHGVPMSLEKEEAASEQDRRPPGVEVLLPLRCNLYIPPHSLLEHVSPLVMPKSRQTQRT